MNTSTTNSVEVGAAERQPVWLLVAALIVLGALAASNQSFWIDEATTAQIARQHSLADWWQAMVNDHGSTEQMPFYMIYVWLWEKFSGTGEWAMRLSNIPWLLLGMGFFFRRSLFFLFAVGLSSFLWYYLNELRPYAMQVAVALILAGSLWRLTEAPRTGGNSGCSERVCVLAFSLALLMLAGCSLLGMIWAAAGLGCAVAVLGFRRVFGLARQHGAVSILSAVILIALAGYYLWTMKQGARASTGKTDLSNCLFAVYELAGLTGLGPGRLEIRSSPVKAFLPFVIPLAIHACLAAYVLVSGVRFIVAKAPARIWLGVTACVGATAAFLFAAGVVMHFRVLGRHFAPLAACFMLATSLGLHRLWDAGGWRRLCAGLFLVISLASAVSSRIAPRHAKDDYREAVAVAQAALARGDRVWWCADGNAAAYYGLVLTDEPVPNGAKQAWLVYNFSASASKNQPEPDLVVFSKPDLYDSQGAVQDYLARERYRIWRPLQAFSLWKKPPEQR